MGQGLGKNTPVVLSLGRENYEALLARHGQFVRWRISNRCTCIDNRTFQPDIHCPKCGGRGLIYDCQKNADVIQTVMSTSNILTVDSEYENASLIKVYDHKGNVYPNAEKNGIFISLNVDSKIVKGEYFTIVMNKSLIESYVARKCKKLGANYFRVEDLRVQRKGIDGIYYTSPCDIIEIGSVEDLSGKVYDISELRQDTFYIDSDTEITELLIAKDIKYVKPSIFAILNQNLNKAEADMIVEAHGDAVVTFPYCYDVSENDVLTVLSGTYTKKEVVNRMNADFDVIGAFFVEKVQKCTGKRDFEQGKDFLLVGTNRIKWICDDAPETKETYSITYSVYPTYTVVKSIPQLRTSEDQRMPKKAIVQMFNSYTEELKVNRQ